MIVIPGEDYCQSAHYNGSVNRRELVEPYVQRTMQQGRLETTMWAVQAFVQQKFEVPLAASATLNPEIVEWIKGGKLLNGVNLLEVNLVCASGLEIAAALGKNLLEADKAQCAKICTDICAKYGCHPGGS